MLALGHDDAPRVSDKQSTTTYFYRHEHKTYSVYTLEMINNNNALRLTTLAKLTYMSFIFIYNQSKNSRFSRR